MNKWKPSLMEALVTFVLGFSLAFAWKGRTDLAMLFCFWCSLILGLNSMKK